jgi:hypothetical protein
MTPPLPFDIICLSEGDRNQAVFMAGHDLRCSRTFRVREKIESEPLVSNVAATFKWQLQPHQSVEQPVLGNLELAPRKEIAGLLNIRNHSVVATGDAILFGGIRGNEPIATLKAESAQKR